MKKVKVSLDKQAIQNFFLQHVEKVVLVIVMLCFLMYVYNAVGRPLYPRTYEELNRAAQGADKKLQETPAGTKLKVPPYREMVEKTSGQINVEYYQQSHMWCPPIHDPPPKRGEPLLETVQDLRGAAGYGAVHAAQLARSAVGRQRSVRGERWIALTGVVPYDAQVKDYEEAFQNAARDQTRRVGGPRTMLEGAPGSTNSSGVDIPVYVYYNVQRVEVKSADQPITEAEWEQGSIRVRDAINDATRDWGGRGAANYGGGRNREVTGGVLPYYLIPVLDFPLPPLVEPWTMGDSIAHPPEIPLYVPPKMVIGPDGRPIREDLLSPEETPTEQPEEATPADAPDQPDRPMDMPGGRPGMPGRMTGEGGMPGYSPEFGMEGEIPGMGIMPGMRPGTKPGEAEFKMPSVRLVRFIDRSVEPGKQYRYRVRLWLMNPNYGKQLRDLERIELAKEQYLTTDWSDPTGVIEVPRDDRVLALGVKPSIRVTSEPTAKVALIKWLNEEGIEADRIFPKESDARAYRGQILNLPDSTWPEVDKRPTRPKKEKKKAMPGPGMMEEGGLFEEMSPPGANIMAPEQQVDTIDVDYLTEAIILDMRGGDRVDIAGNANGSPPSSSDPNLNAPGEVLLLDVNGELVVRDELADTARYEEIQERSNPPTSSEMMMVPGGEGGLFEEEMLMGSPGAERPSKGRPKKAARP